ncbi:MAG: TonB-dependent receptor plug domain-containing protein [Thermaurantiacus sp.]
MMTDLTHFGRLLLLSTALVAAPVLAQDMPAPPTPAEPEMEDEDVEIAAPGAGGLAGEDIVVIGTRIPNVIRATPSVVSVLSQADIARTGEGDIAGALQRVTGLSLVGGKYVYVRGLGERYSAALLNGLPLPSPEPLKRVVPLDIFPTSVIASSVVQKSFLPNFPGEFGGGVINLTTRAVPAERFIEIGGSIGGNTVTSGNLGYTHFGSRSDWTGFDDGTRSVPFQLRSAISSGNRVILGQNFDLQTMQRITASLVNAPTTLIQRNDTIPANMSLSVSAGDAWDIGEDRLGLIFAAGWSNGWETQGGVRQVAAGLSLIDGQPGVRADEDYLFLSTENRVVVNGLFGLGYEFGDSRIRFTNVFVRDSLKESRIEDGLDEPNVGNDDTVNRNYTSWTERQLFTSQLVGEFSFGDWNVNARGTFANSKRRAPYERVNSYRFNQEVNGYTNDLTSNGSFSRIAFSDLDDKVWAGALDVGYRLPTSRPMVLSAGYAYSDNTRTSERRDFRYVTGTGAALPLAVAQTRPDFLLSQFNIQAYGIILQEVSGQQGAALYDAGLRIHAGYGQLEAEIADGLRIAGGVRFEDGRQFVQPIALFGLPPLPETQISEQYWLPGATITWNFAADMQFRLAGSKTVARPQFRELAPQQYRDTDTDRLAQGNPFLVDSELTNVEGRYEWFFGRDERVTLGGFWKKIDRPIETIPFEAGGTFGQTFANAPRATLYGGEVELVKYFYLDNAAGLLENRRILLIGNYTYSKSKISVREGDTTINDAGFVIPASFVFADGQRLTGQSDHLVNVQIGLSHAERLSEQTILINYASDRATQRGPQNTPDYIERPGFQLDFVAREEIRFANIPFELKLEVRNITGTRYQEFQELNDTRVDINKFRRGTSGSISLTAKF